MVFLSSRDFRYITLIAILLLVTNTSMLGQSDSSTKAQTFFQRFKKAIVYQLQTSPVPFIRNKFTALPKVVPPLLIKRELLDGSAIKGQWMGLYGPFALIKENQTPVLYKNDLQSKPAPPLSISQRVRVCYIDPNTHLAYVTDESGGTPLGWVLKEHIAFKPLFKPLDTWYYELLQLCKGDYCAEYATNKKGYFSLKWSSSGQGLKLRGSTKGRFYYYGSLVWPKKVKPSLIHDFFYINQRDDLVIEWGFRDSPYHVK